MKLTKFEGNPIISPNPENHWESLITCNPGVIHDGEKFIMLYRCAGDDEKHVIRFGLAESNDGYHFTRVSDQPVFSPSEDGPDSGCVEDPRIVRFDDCFYITYAYRSYAPGRYWTFNHDEVFKPVCGENSPATIKRNMGNTGLAVTKDFRHFRRLGRLTQPDLDDRDVILFPEKINGQFVLIHRPKQYVGKAYGVEKPSIWVKFSDDMLSWESKPSHLLITGRENTWEDKTGGSTPPIKTNKGWLMLYHGVENGGQGCYRVGATLLDLDNPLKVLARTPDPILEPEYDFEMNGIYNGCVFPTGNVLLDDTLYVYYGAADKYVGVATCKIGELLDYLLSDECRLK